MRNLVKATMEFRAKAKKNCDEGHEEDFPVYKHVSDLAAATLCPKVNETYKCCLERKCDNCGTQKVSLMEEESKDEKDDDGHPMHPCKWTKFEYVKLASGKRKLMLVTKITTPKEMFSFMMSKLENFPAHQFRANWQRQQYDTLRASLPQDHIIAVHDFSENYRCTLFEEPQATYFDREEVSLHVTILHRHSTEADATDAEEQPSIITEEFFVISTDRGHDAHFVRIVRRLMVQYLTEMGCTVKHLHEFTDGCAGQYKCRHTLGDLSYSAEDIGCETHRNFFETSHAKGPQDAAGCLVKRKADSATMRSRSIVIQNAKDLYEYAIKHLCKPSDRSQSKRRVFRYVDVIERPSYRRFMTTTSVGIRKLHQVQSGSTPCVATARELSCYSCDSCLELNSKQCENANITGALQTVTLTHENVMEASVATADTEGDVHQPLQELVNKNSVVAVRADEDGEDYYLIQVVSTGCYKARKDVIDPWSGVEFPRGSDVFRGFYYEKQSDRVHIYRVNNSKLTICPSRAICYLLTCTASEDLELTEDEHLDILSV